MKTIGDLRAKITGLDDSTPIMICGRETSWLYANIIEMQYEPTNAIGPVFVMIPDPNSDLMLAIPDGW